MRSKTSLDDLISQSQFSERHQSVDFDNKYMMSGNLFGGVAEDNVSDQIDTNLLEEIEASSDGMLLDKDED